MSRIAYKHFKESAIIAAWRDPDNIYIYIDPLSPSVYVGEHMFRVCQGDKSITTGATVNTLPKSGHISAPETFTIVIPGGFTDERITLEIIGDEKYKLPVSNMPPGVVPVSDHGYPPTLPYVPPDSGSDDKQYELVPVRRFWHTKKGYHVYVTDPNEVVELQQKHWQEWYDMGVCFFAFVEKK